MCLYKTGWESVFFPVSGFYLGSQGAQLLIFSEEVSHTTEFGEQTRFWMVVKAFWSAFKKRLKKSFLKGQRFFC